MQVKELLKPPVTTCTIKADVAEARDLMQNKGISALPVVNIMGESIKLEGIVSYQDLSGVYDDTINVQQVMTTQVITIRPETTAKEAAQIMIEKKIHHLIVMNNDEIVGIISSFDFVNLVAKA